MKKMGLSNFRSGGNYSLGLIKLILDNIADDDFFYNKKFHWEDWVIMRVDIEEAIDRLSLVNNIDIAEYSSSILDDIYNLLKEYHNV